jgi:hypothetical protein
MCSTLIVFRHFELFLDDFLTVKLTSFGIKGEQDQGKTLLKSMMKKKAEIQHPMDIFICWWRYEDVLMTVVQLVYFNQGDVS